MQFDDTVGYKVGYTVGYNGNGFKSCLDIAIAVKLFSPNCIIVGNVVPTVIAFYFTSL